MPHVLVAGMVHPSGLDLLRQAGDVTFDYVEEISERSYQAHLATAEAVVIRTQPLSAATGAFRLCFDTFRFFRCGDARLYPEHIGLAHMSGIARTDLAPGDLSEPDRGPVFGGDRVGNIAQLKTLLAAGFGGFIAMEPFSPEVQNDPELGAHLRSSLE
jgi:predicted xylose isomerase-like sugar epimerase